MNLFAFNKKLETPTLPPISDDLAGKIENLNQGSAGQRFEAIKRLEAEKESDFEKRAYAIMGLLDLLEKLSPSDLKHSNGVPCSLKEQSIFASKCLAVIRQLSKEKDSPKFTEGIITALLVYGTKEGYLIVNRQSSDNLPLKTLENVSKNSFFSKFFSTQNERPEANASNLRELLHRDNYFLSLQKSIADTFVSLFKQSNNSVETKKLLIEGLLGECGYSHESLSNRAASRAIIKIADVDEASFDCVNELLRLKAARLDNYEKKSPNAFLKHLQERKEPKIQKPPEITRQTSSSSISSITSGFSEFFSPRFPGQKSAALNGALETRTSESPSNRKI